MLRTDRFIPFSRAFCLATCLLATLSSAYGDGYYVDPQSAEGMAVSQAGIPTGYRDGSSAFYNPAALVIDPSYTFSLQAHLLASSAKFRDDGSTVLGVPNVGSQGADGGKTALVPTMYSVIPLTRSITAGVYLNSPYGLGTKFPNDWVGRYQNVETSMVTANLGASVGVELLDGLSIGAGLSALYADVLFSNAIDFGAIGTAALGPETAASQGLVPQQADGSIRIRTSDWGMGWNTGLLYRFGTNKAYRLGVAYRAPTELHFHGGSANFSVPSAAAPLTASGAFAATEARARVTLPETLSLGARVPLSDCLTFVQQSSWTRWSRSESISISFENPAQPSVQESLEWEASWLHSLGLIYGITDDFTLSLGGGFEEGVVPSVRSRSPRLPTSDGIWSSLGASYTLAVSRVRFDLAYARLDFRGGGTSSRGPTGDEMRGSWDSLNQALSFSTTIWW